VKVSVVTPTAERPVAFALAESMMRRQTVQPHEWIVADGGSHETPTPLTMGQRRIENFDMPPGAGNFAKNLLDALDAVTGDVALIWEDDDWYAPTYIERMAALAAAKPAAALYGASKGQNYYNVAHRCWRAFNNVGSSMCQTMVPRTSIAPLQAILRACMRKGSFNVDITLWRSFQTSRWAIGREGGVLGIKGLPGRAGLGVGHRPGIGWSADPDLTRLRQWIGNDADTYAGFIQSTN